MKKRIGIWFFASVSLIYSVWFLVALIRIIFRGRVNLLDFNVIANILKDLIYPSILSLVATIGLIRLKKWGLYLYLFASSFIFFEMLFKLPICLGIIMMKPHDATDVLHIILIGLQIMLLYIIPIVAFLYLTRLKIREQFK